MRKKSWIAALLVTGLAYSAGADPGKDDKGFYLQHNLVSDGAVPADHVDANLMNAWGLVSTPTSPWWVANNHSDTATLYTGAGVAQALVVDVPGDPTGIVFNGGAHFVVSDGNGHSGAARFIFAGEGGVIAGWNSAVPPPAPSTQAQIAVDDSASGTVYKGLAISGAGNTGRLYATDFHNGKVDMYDGDWNEVTINGAFTDKKLPKGYAPFGIANIGGIIFVTYAQQDADAHDDVAGHGHGFINAYDLDGKLLRRIASRGDLDSPWGMAMAPEGFGKFSGNLLVGNFGSGEILAFDLGQKIDDGPEAHHRGALEARHGKVHIEKLWGLAFGNGAAAGPTTTLFFTAGPNDENDGLFGTIVFTPEHP